MWCYPTKPTGEVVSNNVQEAIDSLQDWLQSGSASAYVRDISVSKKSVYVCLGTSLLFTFIYMYMMAYCSTCLAYISLAVVELFHIAAIGGGIYLATKQANKGADPTSYYIMAGVFAFTFLVTNCLICCFRDKFAIALAVIDSAADFLVSTKRLACIPLFYFLFAIIYLVLWAAAVPGVIALNDISVKQNTTGLQEKQITYNTQGLVALGAMGVGAIWLLIFLTDKVRFIVFSCASEYYFESNKTTYGGSSVCGAWSSTFCKHSGTIALGSAIHTLIVVIKILIEIFSNAADSSDNGIVKCIACLARCFIGCVESAVEWLNTCAYAMTAIGGHTYCQGAWGGFMLYLKHLLKFYFASYIASGFILLGMIGVVAGNMGLCWLMISMVF